MRSGRVVNRCKVFCVCALVLWVFFALVFACLFYARARARPGARGPRATAQRPRAPRARARHATRDSTAFFASLTHVFTHHTVSRQARAHCSITLGTGRIGSVALYLLLIPGAVW